MHCSASAHMWHAQHPRTVETVTVSDPASTAGGATGVSEISSSARRALLMRLSREALRISAPHGADIDASSPDVCARTLTAARAGKERT